VSRETGKEIERVRRSMGLSTRQAGRIVPVAPSFLWEIEQGRKAPGSEMAERLIATFGPGFVRPETITELRAVAEAVDRARAEREAARGRPNRVRHPAGHAAHRRRVRTRWHARRAAARRRPEDELVRPAQLPGLGEIGPVGPYSLAPRPPTEASVRAATLRTLGLVSPQEAARMLGVTPRHVRRLVLAGALIAPARGPRGRLISVASIEQRAALPRYAGARGRLVRGRERL
jgi:plasmid maintenance system antidote protein VapI